MKWFKHQCGANRDEKLCALEARCGLEGYGFYFKILEFIGEKVGPENIAQVEYSAKIWARKLNITTKKFTFLAQCCADVGLISFQCRPDVYPMLSQCRSDFYLISCSNLLKYRDNHTKNLQVTSKQDKELDKEEELEEELEKDIVGVSQKIEPDKPPTAARNAPPTADQKTDPKPAIEPKAEPTPPTADDSAQKPEPKKPKAPRGSRQPPDWQMSEADLAFCKAERTDLEPQAVADSFRDYWLSKTGANASKMDWAATWRNWVRSQRFGFGKQPKEAAPARQFKTAQEGIWERNQAVADEYIRKLQEQKQRDRTEIFMGDVQEVSS